MTAGQSARGIAAFAVGAGAWLFDGTAGRQLFLKQCRRGSRAVVPRQTTGPTLGSTR